MKLSEIVKCLNYLDQTNLDLVCRAAMNQFQEVNHAISSPTLYVDTFSNDFNHSVKSVSENFANIHQAVDNIKNDLRRKIFELEPEYYQQSQSLYDGEKRYYPSEYLLNRRLGNNDQAHNMRFVNEESREFLQHQLLKHSDWRLPGMIIHPGVEQFIDYLVALDPLYLVDQREELLVPAMQRFPEAYQRRLRPYVIDDYAYKDVLWQLPSNQFGFVFAYNYFNYKPMKVLCQYLDSIYTKLRPGGTVLFTYNDCDVAHGIALAEVGAACYTPARAIKAHAESLGFEIVSTHRGQVDVSWMELKKPGEITSIRGGQSLAKIVAT